MERDYRGGARHLIGYKAVGMISTNTAESGDTRHYATPKSGNPSGNGPETRANTEDCTACKAVYIDSIPGRASKKIKYLNPLLRVFCWCARQGAPTWSESPLLASPGKGKS